MSHTSVVPDLCLTPSPVSRTMSSTPLAETEEDVFDLTEAVPETERLDSSLQKAKAQLSIKTRRHRPSRSRLRDSLSSTEDDSLDGKGSVPASCPSISAPLHCPAPFSDSTPAPCPARRDRAFTLEPFAGERRSHEQRGRYKHLADTPSPDAPPTVPPPGSAHPCSRSQTSSPAHLRQEDQMQLREGDHYLLHQRDHSQSEDDGHEVGSDEPGSPTVLLDKKTRRRFLDLGVTLRRTYGKVKRDRGNRLSAGNRDSERTEGRSSRSSAPPFVHFSWFSDRFRGSSSPKSASQTQANMEGSRQDKKSEACVGLLESNGETGKPEASHPYRSLSEYSDEGCEGAEPSFTKKKSVLPFSTGAKERIEKHNGVHGEQDGHNGDEQKLLTS